MWDREHVKNHTAACFYRKREGFVKQVFNHAHFFLCIGPWIDTTTNVC